MRPEKFKCSCGREHSCPIDVVDVSENAVASLKEYCAGKKVLLISDVHTYAVCGKTVSAEIDPAVDLILEDNGSVLIPNEEAIEKIENQVTPDTEIIVGVGSGVINDLCKYEAERHSVPCCIVATAPSMDGFASSGAALILGGMKVTLPVKPPRGIFALPSVLAGAPYEMIAAGYGDIIGKFSCLYDWKLGKALFDEYFCGYVFDTVLSVAKRTAAAAEKIAARDPEAICELMQALVDIGIAMSYVGNSRPASGSEHHLSHYFEIRGILDKKPYFPHGIDVAYSSIVTARLREKIIEATPKREKFDRAEWEKNIRRVYTTSADGIIALQDKLGWYEREDETVAKWDGIKAVLAEVPGEKEFKEMLGKVGLHFEDFIKLYGKDRIGDALFYAKDLKDRYTVLWLYDLYFKNVKILD